MSNLSNCKQYIEDCIRKINKTLIDGAGTASVEQKKTLKNQREILKQQHAQLTNKERQDKIDEADDSIKSVTEEAKILKDSIEASENIKEIIGLIAAFINIITTVINILPAAPIVSPVLPAIGGRSLFSPHATGFLAANTSSITSSIATARDEDPNSIFINDKELVSLRAERNFLRCMISYLLINPISPDEWLMCTQINEFVKKEENDPETLLTE